MDDFTITTNVGECARCGEDHNDIKFKELIRPIKDNDGRWTHWALCPTNKEPIIMMRITQS